MLKKYEVSIITIKDIKCINMIKADYKNGFPILFNFFNITIPITISDPYNIPRYNLHIKIKQILKNKKRFSNTGIPNWIIINTVK